LVYAGALRANIGHGKSGYYFGIAGEYTLLSAAQTIGSTLVDQGFAKTSQPSTFTTEDLQKYYGGSEFMGTNSRGVADRSKSIGWKPRDGDLEDLWDHIKTEVGRVEKKYGRKFEGGGGVN
jgi:hypothetical protein